MQFYSGFSLKDEAYLFAPYIKQSDFSVCGFSYGAIAALNATLEMLETSRRVDRLQLFSPAFFQTKEQKFLYMNQFIKACFSPYEKKILSHKETSIEELKELLEYEWDAEKLREIEACGVKIEVYLGGKDAIIDVEGAREFFLEYATLTYIKDANHFLQLS